MVTGTQDQPAAKRSVEDIVFEKVNGSRFNPERRILSEENRKLARKLIPRGEKKTNATKLLAERYLKGYAYGAGLAAKQDPGSHKVRQVWNNIGRIQESRMIRAWHDEEFRINGKDGVNFQEMNNIIYHGLEKRYKKGTILAETLRTHSSLERLQEKSDRRLSEHTVMGVGLTQYGRYIEDQLRIGTWEMCEEVSVAPILNLFGRIQVECGQQRLVTDLVPMDVWRELHPMAENEPTPFFGVGNPAETELPLRHKIKFAYAIKREAVCRGLDVALREIMTQGAVQIDRYWAPHIIRNAFGIYTNTNDNEWNFRLNGQRYANEYLEPNPANADLFPYTNMIINQQDISRNDDALFILIEQLIREQVDFRTGNPIECVQGLLNIVGTGFVQLENIRSGLGAVNLHISLGGPGNPEAEQIRSGRSRWNPTAFDNVWVERYLRELMENVLPWSAWTDAERTQAIDRSIVAGNLQRAMVIQDEWAQEEFDMPTQWTDFDREDIWGRKFMRKSGLASLIPQARFVVRGWPDTQPVPAAPVAP